MKPADASLIAGALAAVAGIIASIATANPQYAAYIAPIGLALGAIGKAFLPDNATTASATSK